MLYLEKCLQYLFLMLQKSDLIYCTDTAENYIKPQLMIIYPVIVLKFNNITE